ncbi:unnamed protein product [Linum trigynum]|uniref:Uncharacterized protein n=1 Tax=Linum trigynum TaxID=586398 RepID=A0AAV2F9N2_9ROSI
MEGDLGPEKQEVEDELLTGFVPGPKNGDTRVAAGTAVVASITSPTSPPRKVVTNDDEGDPVSTVSEKNPRATKSEVPEPRQAAAFGSILVA